MSVVDDLRDEPNEMFMANLTLVTNNDRVSISPAQASILISDNDGTCTIINYASIQVKKVNCSYAWLL